MANVVYSHDTHQNQPSLQYQSPPQVYVENRDGQVVTHQQRTLVTRQPNGVVMIQQSKQGPEIIDPVYQVCIAN